MGEIVARDGMIIFDAQNQNAAFRAGKSGHIFCHLIPNRAAVPGCLVPSSPSSRDLRFLRFCDWADGGKQGVVGRKRIVLQFYGGSGALWSFLGLMGPLGPVGLIKLQSEGWWVWNRTACAVPL